MNKFKCIAVACSLALVLSATGCGKSNSKNTNTVEMVSTATNADGDYASIAGTWEDDNLNKIVIRSDGKFLTYNGNNEVTEEDGDLLEVGENVAEDKKEVEENGAGDNEHDK